MPKKQRKFADDGWAVWVDGEDTSTVYINDWINPKGKSFVDMAVRVRGISSCTGLHVYIPFKVSREEIADLSLSFNDTKILQAIFSTACIVDYMKNEHTSEVAYNGKTVDIVHISTLNVEIKALDDGTLMNIDISSFKGALDNDEAYFIWRMPHKTLDEVFKPCVSVGSMLTRLRDLLTTPVISEKYGYSIRINEARLLPEEITRIGAFHRQKLTKASVTISVNEDYELNDLSCYRIHRLEERLYDGYLPVGYKSEDVITYQWQQDREDSYQGHFNFYYNISKESISRASLFLYMLLLTLIGVLGNLIASYLWELILDLFS
ncbi:MAG: hypothetical protein J6Q69_02750 [Clostridia bacterium]|nr:hypothetical protein [Clostridia bacterium]